MMPARPPQPTAAAGPSSSSDNNNSNNNNPSPTTARSFTAFLVPPPLTFYVQLGNGVQLEITPSPERLLSSLLGAGTGTGAGTGAGIGAPFVPLVPIVFTTPLGDSGAGVDSDAMLRAVHELFMRSQSESHGPPPTSKAFLDALPLKTWDAATCASEKYTECAICLSEYETDDQVLSLPCGHAFHRDCGMPWLVDHNVCPTCRYQMPTQQSDKPAAASSAGGASATASAASPSTTSAAAAATATITPAADTTAAASNSNSNSSSSSSSSSSASEHRSADEPEEEPAFERMLRTLLGVRRERSPTFSEPQPVRTVRQRVDPVDATTLPGAVPVTSSSGINASTSSNTSSSDSAESDIALESMLEEEATRFVAEETAKHATASVNVITSGSDTDVSDAAIFDDVDLDELLRDTRPVAGSVATAAATPSTAAAAGITTSPGASTANNGSSA